MEINWKKLGMEDKEIIQHYYDMEPVRNCEFTFANNFLWAPFYGIRYAVVEDMLVFISDEAEMSVSCPLGKADMQRTVEALLRYFGERGKPFKMHLVSPKQFEELERLYPDRFQVEYDRDAADYVYESERLISLAGKKLHGKRNHINRFKENYPEWSYERITEENTAECMEMAEQWRVQNHCSERGEMHDEFCVTMNALKYRKELELQGGLIRADGRVVAFPSESRVGRICLWCISKKRLQTCRGLILSLISSLWNMRRRDTGILTGKKIQERKGCGRRNFLTTRSFLWKRGWLRKNSKNRGS